MSIITTSGKGQVVIPKKEREKVGIKPGSKVVVEVVDDHIEIYPLPENPIEYFCGIFNEGNSLTKVLIKERKEDFVREEKKAVRLLRHSRVSKQGK